MSRLITIEVTGDEKGYSAMVSRITEQNRRLNRDAQRGAHQTTAAFNAMRAALLSISTALVPVLSAAALLGLGRAALNAAGQLQDLSEQTGVSAQTLASLKTIAEQSGSSMEEVGLGIQRMFRSLIEAQGGTNEASQALQKLGLSLADIAKLSTDPNEALAVLTNRLGRIENPIERLALAMDLAGRSGGKLAPILTQIADQGLDKLRQSTSVTDETIERLDRLGDAFTRLKNKILEWSQVFLAALFTDPGPLEQIRKLGERIEELNRRIAATTSPILGQRLESGRLGLIRELADLQEQIDRVSGAKFKPPGTDPKLLEAQAKFIDKLGDKARDLEVAFRKVNEPQAAALIQIRELEKEARQFSDPTITNLIERIKLWTLAGIEHGATEKRRKEELAELGREVQREAEAEAQLIEVRSALSQQTERQLNLDAQLSDLEVERLRALGLTTEAERLQLQLTIERNRRRIELIQTGQLEIENSSQHIEILKRQMEIAQISLGNVTQASIDAMTQTRTATINIGQHVARTLEDMFTALITGTLKSVDVGQAALGTLGRILADIFRQTIDSKLSFETTLFSNLRRLPAQATAAVVAGSAALPNVSQAAANASFGGQNFGSPTFFPPPVGGLGGLALAGAGGFGIGRLLGGGGLGSQIGGLLGGVAGQAIGTAPMLIASGLSGPIFGTLSGGLGGALSGVFGSTLGTALGGLILPGIGAIAGALLGSLFGTKSRKATSPQRRAAAFQVGIQQALDLGFDISRQEQELLSQAAQSGAATEQLHRQLGELSIGALVARIENLRAKGGRALGGLPIIEEELLRRGVGEVLTGAPITPAVAERVERQQAIKTLIEQQINNLGPLLGDALTRGVNEIRPEFAFRQFLEGFSNAITNSVTGALTQAFIAERVLPIIAGQTFSGILQAITGIGTERTAVESMDLIRPLLTEFRADLQSLQPAFIATVEFGRVIGAEITAALGTAKPVEQNVEITINGNVRSEEDIRDLERRIAALLLGQIAPVI